MRLADLQASLAASLAAGSPAPPGCDARALERARRALESKRRRVAGHLLPRLRAVLRDSWRPRFAEHAQRYNPSSQLHHIDDAWELAEALRRDSDPAVAAAAHDDLVGLRLRFVRHSEAGAGRIRERRGLLVARLLTPPAGLVVRLPGAGGKVLRWPLPLPPSPIPSLPPGEGEKYKWERGGAPLPGGGRGWERGRG